MGTKRIIAPQVAELVDKGPQGPLLDLFSGICAIGSEISPSRQVWCNDVQVFASTVSEAFFTSPGGTIHSYEAIEDMRKEYSKNYRTLQKRFSTEVKKEEDAFISGNITQIRKLENEMQKTKSMKLIEKERRYLADNSSEFPYRLFTTTFSGSYIGLIQSMDIDSIRYAADRLESVGRISKIQHRWFCLALCQALSKVATTTGHFAQFMRVKEKTKRRFLAQRRRSVWDEWNKALLEFSPVGTSRWRKKNRVFMMDANKLLERLNERELKPAVVYADPPYTSDQYSRYYHLYETLLIYDYPYVTGTGRYRTGRFSSDFSMKTEVNTAMEKLIENCAKLGSQLILSYPANGLLENSRKQLTTMIQKHFGGIESVDCIDHYHSSLGGSKGKMRNSVKELLFVSG